MSLSLKREEAARKYHSLDALRGFAALAVVMLHYKDFVRPLYTGSAQLAVDVFFLMSGVVIAKAYDKRIASGMTVQEFLIARVIRLYPLYAFGLALGLLTPLVSLIAGYKTQWNAASLIVSTPFAILMLPSPKTLGMPGSLYPFNFPAWSLFFELLVNILYATLLARLRSSVLLFGTVIAAVALALGAFYFRSIDGGPKWDDAWMGMLRVLFSFCAGVSIARQTVQIDSTRSQSLSLIAIAVVMLLIFIKPITLVVEYQLFCVLIVFPCAVTACVISRNAMNTGWMTWLGLCSYPLYMIHVPTIPLVERAFNKLLHSHPSAYSPLSGVGLIVMLTLVSWVLAITYDVRARRILSSIFKSRR